MTLTHILPSLRSTLPTPIARDLWPEFTTTSVSDVTVAGVSLVRLAGWCGTPCVHTAAAVIPQTGGIPSPTEVASVIVTRVVAVSQAEDGTLDAWIDARLSDTHPVAAEARLIGRISTAHDAIVRLHAAGESAMVLSVPEIVRDLRAGDLIALPCTGTARLRDVDPDRLHLARDVDGEPGWSSAVCGR